MVVPDNDIPVPALYVVFGGVPRLAVIPLAVWVILVTNVPLPEVATGKLKVVPLRVKPVSYTHLRAHET